MSNSFTFVIDHPDGNGIMVYDVSRDEWFIDNRAGHTVARIDANAYRTIREFKAWAFNELTNQEVQS